MDLLNSEEKKSEREPEEIYLSIYLSTDFQYTYHRTYYKRTTLYFVIKNSLDGVKFNIKNFIWQYFQIST